ARRGRRRPKAERADRQRRESLRARHARPPDRTAQFTPKASAPQRAQDDLRRQAHGALRAPVTDVKKVRTSNPANRPNRANPLPCAGRGLTVVCQLTLRTVSAHRGNEQTPNASSRPG